MVGTILLLALTVTLFASIFFFVNTFPRPPPQPANQFQGQLLYGGAGGKTIVSIHITHLAGPTLAGSEVFIYLFSTNHPSRFPAPYHISDGLNGSSVWNLGQTWTLNITNKTLTVPDNITVSIVTPSQLLFRATLPGTNPNLPPEFFATGTNPALPAIGQGFVIFAQIVDNNLNLNSVFVNVSQLPGLSGTSAQPMTPPGATGYWTYSVANGATTSAGTFYVFVNASDSLGQPNTVAIAVTISPGSVTQTNVRLTASPTAPVNNTVTTLTAFVTNPGSSAGTATVTFTARGVAIGGAVVGPIGAGATATFSKAWTPTRPGSYLIAAQANVTGGGSVSGTLNLTVFPKILFIAHNVLAGASTAFNESALLAEELTAAGVPFTNWFLTCTGGLPTSGAFNIGAFDVTIIDYGSTTGGGCTTAPTAAEQTKITTASSTSFWVVGANAFSAAPCNSYNANYFTLFGIKRTAGSTCDTAVVASAAATYTANAGSGLRADGIGSLTINKTIGSSSAFEPYFYFALGGSPASSVFLTASGKAVATFHSAANTRNVAMATDPALLADGTPNGQAWGLGEGGTTFVYNVMNYLCGFATSTSPGRALVDYAASGLVLVGLSHTHASTIYASARANGIAGGVVAVTLLVNGTPALFQGQVVSTTITLAGSGSTTWVALVWQAPGAGSYSISIIVSSFEGDLYFPNNQMPASVLNQAVVFT